MVIKIIDSTNFGWYSWWASGLYYAANNGANVINMSVGGESFSSSLLEAVDYAYQSGCFIAASMMNFNNNVPYYPAAYDSQVVAVGATDSYDQRCSPFFWGGGSNYGPHIDVVAPGNYIYGLNNLSNTDYSWYWGGTSQATPMVTGLAALLLAKDSSRTPLDLRSIIRATADDTVGRPQEDTPGFDYYHGYGRINCYRALTYPPSSVFGQDETTPVDFILFANYPNPFNPITTFRFALPHRSVVKLDIYNNLGQFVATVVDEELDSGSYEVNWNAGGLSSGVYFYRLHAGEFTTTKKLVLLK